MSDGILFKRLKNDKLIPSAYIKYDSTGFNIGRVFIDAELMKTILDEAAKDSPKLDNPYLDFNTATFVNEEWKKWFLKWFGSSKEAK